MRLIVILLLLASTATAQSYTYDFDASCQAAYRHFMALRIEEGRQELQNALRKNPNNLTATFVADYEDCLLLLINGNPADFANRRSHYDQRLDQLDNGPESSPWHRLCRAGIHMHWALVYMRFGERYKAIMAFRKSYLLLKDNMKEFPDFAYQRVFYGTEEAAVGTLPEDYKWIASIFGMKGNVNHGIGVLTAFLNSHPNPNEPFRDEAVIYYAYLRFYLQHQQEAVWTYINAPGFAPADNLLRLFAKANLSLNYHKADAALKTLQQAQHLSNYRTFPMLDYEMGNALLLKLDTDALTSFQQFLSRYKGGWYVKDAWEKIAWIYLLQYQPEKAKAALSRVKAGGSTISDADRMAQRAAETGIFPHPLLLQVRLLSDGGYHHQALEKLGTTSEAGFPSISDKLEYNYRLGKAQDDLEADGKAVAAYQRAIALGRDRPEQYAARSALQMGILYERSGQKAQAIAAFQNCLSMRHHDFQSTLDQQAKAGIDRLSH